MRHDSENQTRILTKVIREVLARQMFTSMADLTDAVKTRCAKLRLKVTDDALNQAFTLIASNTSLTVRMSKPVPPLAPTPRPVSRAEAAKILQELRARMLRETPVCLPSPSAPGAPEHFPQLMPVSK